MNARELTLQFATLFDGNHARDISWKQYNWLESLCRREHIGIVRSHGDSRETTVMFDGVLYYAVKQTKSVFMYAIYPHQESYNKCLAEYKQYAEELC